MKDIGSAEHGGARRKKRRLEEEGTVSEERHAKQRLTSWGYGEGVDGYKRIELSADGLSTMLVDQGFPWWWSSAISLDLNINRIWLTSSPSIDIDIIQHKWCAGTPVEVGPNPSHEFLCTLRLCKVLLCGKGLPTILLQHKIWKSPTLQVVIATSQFQKPNKDNWILRTHTVEHAMLGGVTNGKFKLHIAFRNMLSIHTLKFSDEMFILQDLRWVLKSGIGGSNIPPPEDTCRSAVSSVIYCAKGTLSHASLVPVNRLDTRVQAQGFGKQWVSRPLSAGERLRIMDVPERLTLICPNFEEQSSILSSITVPGKVLHYVLKNVMPCLYPVAATNDVNSDRKKHCLNEDTNTITIESLPSSNKRRRIETDIYPNNAHGFNCRLLIDQSIRERKRLPTIHEDDVYEDETLRECDLDIIENAPPEVSPGDPNQKATKHDDAEVRVALWDSRLILPFMHWILGRDVSTALLVLRRWMLGLWRRRVLRSYISWKKYAIVNAEVASAAQDCIRRACDASWWNWDGGSRPFFWRWPSDYNETIRTGHKPWFSAKMKRWFKRRNLIVPDKVKGLIADKLNVIRSKRYVEKGNVHSLMPFFHVPKGPDDIRMVYDGSANGLNSILWAPWFTLPTVDSLVRALEPGYGMADNDVGEMFHNFILHKEVQQYCGLDLTSYFEEETHDGNKYIIERWTRLAMGLRCSPYMAVQAMSIAQEVILGDPTDEAHNVFHWSTVHLNLPGSSNYTPAQPWFSKRRRDGKIAADCFIYVDDIRCSAPTIEEAWEAAQRTSSTLAYLGLQDAARKRRCPSREPGAWTGSVVWTTNDEVSVLTTQDKWDKMKEQLKWIANQMSNARGIESKKLKSIRGFLVYISRTYPAMVPYLKGIHLTIDSWRDGRDIDGWKIKPSTWAPTDSDDIIADPKFRLDVQNPQEPAFVVPVPRLKYDIKCLLDLSDAPEPPRRRVRMSKQAQVVYGFGDASKQGFGASIELPDKQIYWRYGQWTLEDETASNLTANRNGHSSNYRELRNLVEALEAGITNGDLHNCDIFMFTDNSTAESAYNKGTSSSRFLFELILRLRKIEMSGVSRIHLVHIAGTRMIYQGTDGLSRGDHTAGVMAGEKMLDFVPLHLDAFSRSPKVKDWMISWLTATTHQSSHLKFLCPDEWPISLIDPLIYIWTPPPAVADIAGEFMARSIHKRPNATHIFICPRLMTARWMRLINKATDMQLRIPVGSPIWETSQHEPLILTIAFPLSSSSTGRYKDTRECEQQRATLQEMLVGNFESAGFTLCKLFTQARSVGSM